MKRPVNEYEIAIVWPLFTWRRCLECGMEFRREFGWFIKSETMPRGRYICRECAPKPDDAIQIYRRRIRV